MSESWAAILGMQSGGEWVLFSLKSACLETGGGARHMSFTHFSVARPSCVLIFVVCFWVSCFLATCRPLRKKEATNKTTRKAQERLED